LLKLFLFQFSDLKELKCLMGFTIEVLNLSRNPVCDTEDKERYRRYAYFLLIFNFCLYVLLLFQGCTTIISFAK
jgi:dipeptide/tripeptide permease